MSTVYILCIMLFEGNALTININGLKQRSKKCNAARYTVMLSYYYCNKHWGK